MGKLGGGWVKSNIIDCLSRKTIDDNRPREKGRGSWVVAIDTNTPSSYNNPPHPHHRVSDGTLARTPK
eukprot:14543645-Heterocapsa_arctica.AAC.1